MPSRYPHPERPPPAPDLAEALASGKINPHRKPFSPPPRKRKVIKLDPAEAGAIPLPPTVGNPTLPGKPVEPAWELPRALGLGEAMRLQRKMRGVTLQQLADAVACAKSYLSQIETDTNAGTPAAELIEAIERVLQMRPGDLAERSAWRSAPEPIKQHVARLARRDRAAQQLALLVRERGIDALYRSGELGELVNQIAPPPPEEIATANAPLRLPRGLVGTPEWNGGDSPVPAPSQSSQKIDAAPVELPLEVPLINSVAAGYPRAFTDLGYPARVADQYVRSPDVRDPDAFACRVVGDSMEPDYREGDVVIFSPAKAVKDGADCFVRFERDEETTFKRVFLEREGDEKSPVVRLRLQPLNGKYPARTVAREDIAGMYAAVSVMRAIG